MSFRSLLPPAGVSPRGPLSKHLLGRGAAVILDPSDIGTMYARWSSLPNGLLTPTTPGTVTGWANNDTSAPAGAALDLATIVSTPVTVASDGNATVMMEMDNSVAAEGVRLDIRGTPAFDTERAALQAMETGAVYARLKFSAVDFSPTVFFGALNNFLGRHARFGIDTSRRLSVTFGRPGASTGGEETWTSTATLSLNTKYNVMFVQDGTAMVGYINGVQVPLSHVDTSTPTPDGDPGDWIADIGGANAPNGLCIGLSVESDGGQASLGMDGHLDEVGMYANGVVPTRPEAKQLSAFLDLLY